MKKSVQIFVMSALLHGCGSDPEFDKRAQYWDAEIASFFLRERTLDDLQSWLQQRGIQFSHDHSISDDHVLGADLEISHVTTLRCEWRTATLRVSADESHRITSHSIYNAGTCLW
jgi:hypothetical protein